MNNPTALEVVLALSEGCNPLTGEQFEPQSIYNSPAVIRAIFAAKIAMERCALIDERRRAQPEKTGRTWTSDEEALLVKNFEAGKTFHALALELARTPGAVHARLIKLGKIEDTGQLRFVNRA